MTNNQNWELYIMLGRLNNVWLTIDRTALSLLYIKKKIEVLEGYINGIRLQ